jgi:hypothetical protein
MDIYSAIFTTVGFVVLAGIMFGILALHYWLESKGKELILWIPIALVMFAFLWWGVYQAVSQN